MVLSRFGSWADLRDWQVECAVVAWDKFDMRTVRRGSWKRRFAFFVAILLTMSLGWMLVMALVDSAAPESIEQSQNELLRAEMSAVRDFVWGSRSK